jgi:hypothetical protein
MSERTITGSLPRLKRALQETAAQVRVTTVREAWCSLGWRWMGLVSALFVLDLLFALPVWLRWAGLAGQAGLIAWNARIILAQRKRLLGPTGIPPERAARVVEERHPELDNALINAVQFERAVPEAPDPQASLMLREMARAESAVAAVPLRDAVDRAGERRAMRRLGGFAAAWLLVALLFPAGFFAVMPRLFFPWMDDVTPPFSFTRFEVAPPGTTLRAGESLPIRITVTGPVPQDVALMTRTRGTEWRRIALDSREPGRYAVTLDSLHEDTWYFAQGGGARSARYLARVLSPPAAKSLRAAYTYPAYTGKPPHVETVGEQGIHGLQNTRVQLEVTGSRSLGSGDLLVRTEDGKQQRVALARDPKENSRVAGEFLITASGEFRVSLVSEDGQSNPDAARGKITLERGHGPQVWIRHPGEDLLVTPDMSVPILVEAEDDVGVARLDLHRTINDLDDSPLAFPLPSSAPRVTQTTVMDLADLGVRPGDQITYYADAYDNDPGRPNFAETEPYHLKVVTPEEYQRILKEQQTAEDLARQAKDLVSAVQDLAERQQRLAQKMEQLQKQLAKNPNDAALKKEMQAAQAEQKALQQEARQLAQLMREYARTPSGSDLERAIKKQLAQMAQQMNGAASGAMQQAQGGDPGQAAEGARAAAQQLGAVNQQMQRQVQRAIEHLEKIMPLYNDVERFKALLDQQGQLVLRARQFQAQSSNSSADRAKMEHLAAEQDRIRGELRQLQEDLRRHAQEAKGDFPRAARTATKIADEIGQRQIPGLMQSGHDRFRQSNGPEGFAQSQRALQQMQAMVSECRACQGEGESELDLALSRSLGSGLGGSLGQLLSGQGLAMGASGMGPGQSGSAGGGFAVRGPRAYQPGMRSISGGGGGQRHRVQNRVPGQPAGLAPEDVEVMKNPARRPPRASDADSGRYPAEYRKMISDYFRSVAEQK